MKHQTFAHKKRTSLNRQPGLECNFPGCDKKFRQKVSLRKHERVAHQKHMFFCKVPGCDRECVDRDELKLHKLYVHENPYLMHGNHYLEKMLPLYADTETNSQDIKPAETLTILNSYRIVPLKEVLTSSTPLTSPSVNQTGHLAENFCCNVSGCNIRYREKYNLMKHQGIAHKKQKVCSDIPGCDIKFTPQKKRKSSQKSREGVNPSNKKETFFHGQAGKTVADTETNSQNIKPAETLTILNSYRIVPLKEVLTSSTHLTSPSVNQTGHLAEKFCCNVSGCNRRYQEKYNLMKHQGIAHKKQKVCSDISGCDIKFTPQKKRKSSQKSREGVNPSNKKETFFHGQAGKTVADTETNSQNIKPAETLTILNSYRQDKSECDFTGNDEQFEKKLHTLSHHKKIHTNAEKLCCDVKGCFKEFWQKDDLRYHERVVHLKNLFCCDIKGCEKIYTQERELKQHKMTIHKNPDSLSAQTSSDEESTLEQIDTPLNSIPSAMSPTLSMETKETPHLPSPLFPDLSGIPQTEINMTTETDLSLLRTSNLVLIHKVYIAICNGKLNAKTCPHLKKILKENTAGFNQEEYLQAYLLSHDASYRIRPFNLFFRMMTKHTNLTISTRNLWLDWFRKPTGSTYKSLLLQVLSIKDPRTKESLLEWSSNTDSNKARDVKAWIKTVLPNETFENLPEESEIASSMTSVPHHQINTRKRRRPDEQKERQKKPMSPEALPAFLPEASRSYPPYTLQQWQQNLIKVRQLPDGKIMTAAQNCTKVVDKLIEGSYSGVFTQADPAPASGLEYSSDIKIIYLNNNEYAALDGSTLTLTEQGINKYMQIPVVKKEGSVPCFNANFEEEKFKGTYIEVKQLNPTMQTLARQYGGWVLAVAALSPLVKMTGQKRTATLSDFKNYGHVCLIQYDSASFIIIDPQLTRQEDINKCVKSDINNIYRFFDPKSPAESAEFNDHITLTVVNSSVDMRRKPKTESVSDGGSTQASASTSLGPPL